MNATLKWVGPIALVLACVAGCKEEPAPAPTPVPTPVASPAASVAPAAPAVPDEDLPVTADFADEAAKEIDKANVESELTKLEKEIAATPE